MGGDVNTGMDNPPPLFVVTKVLFERRGENSTTSPDPVAPYVEGAVDMNSTVQCCLSYDDDQLIRVLKYDVQDVTLPAWLSVEEWIKTSLKWKWNWGGGVDPTWPEAWQRGLLYFSTLERYVYAQLLGTKKFRSQFRQAMCHALIEWLEKAPEDRKYPQPLSSGQWGALTKNAPYTLHEATSLGERLYRDRSILLGIPK